MRKITVNVSNELGEKTYTTTLDNGLKVYICKKEGFSKKIGLFGTKYGSLINDFVDITTGKRIKVPDGIAHFLEHKLFEKEGANALDLFSKMGVSSNAYTSFDQTVFYFETIDKFKESIEMLVKLIKEPYFTDENVEKEQGIIGQEIGMYDDDPGFSVYFNALRAMYINHPIRIDIAGTVETISHINKELLYTCYNTFYSPQNMFYIVVGDVDVEETIDLIEKNINKDIKCLKKAKQSVSSAYAVEFKDVFFTYESLKSDILKGIDLNVKKGEILSVLGSNGSGKSTLLSIAAGLNKAYSGKIEIDGQNIKKLLRNKMLYKKTAMLTQDIQTSFLTDVVCEELDGELLTPVYDFTPFKNMHPYDLSGGQQQLLGLAKLLKKNPEILLLDEPTKGLDGHWKMIISETLLKLKESGITILMVTHDTELAAVCSDRCVLLFNGITLEPQSPSDFFCGGLYYTTSAAKVSDGFFDKICTTKQLIEICRLNGLCMEGEK